MPTPDRQWIILRIHAEFPFFDVRYSDSSRRRREHRLEWEPHVRELPLDQLIASANLPESISTLLPGPRPLPVFIEIPRIFRRPDFRFRPSQQDGAEFVQLSPARPVRRSLFRLPFRILALGEPAHFTLEKFQENYWYRDAMVSDLGVRIQFAEIPDLEYLLRRDGADIIIASDRKRTLEACRHLPENRFPRLLIILSPERDLTLFLPGVAELRIPPSDAVLDEFLLSLAHDFPLHAGLNVIRHRSPQSQLIADPFTNHSLRLFDAFLHVRHQADRTAPYVASVPHEARKDWEIPHPEDVAGPPEFESQSESTGMVPMVRAMSAQRAAIHHATRYHLHTFAQRAAMLDLHIDIPESPDRRVVNVALRRLETQPLLTTVRPDYALLPGVAYELKVNIANRSEDSLVTGEQPPIAPLLPPQQQGHEIEIAIHAKDFQLLSRRVRRVLLPATGPSDPVYFRIRTPEKVPSAQLRICIYYRNQLVQSYLLTAHLADSGEKTEREMQNGVTAHLEYSRRKDQPWELAGVQRRDLSIGANQTGRSHQLIFKSSNLTKEVTLPERTFEKDVNDLRTLLDSLIESSPDQERIYPQVPPCRQPAPDVADAFRDMMRRGRRIYLAFQSEATKAGLKKTLLGVAAGVDQKLQVVRFVDQFVFPWALLYDFPLPDERSGDPPLPICLGQVTDSNGAVIRCSHTNKDEVFCVRGFWGIRHFVEELLVQGNGKVTSLARPSRGPVRVVAASYLAESATLETDLKTMESATETGPAATVSLLDLLWADPPQRPAILILLAHCATEDVTGEPTGARVLLGGNEWLTLNQLSNRVAATEPWDDPRPIIIQTTCNAADVNSTTANHFLTEWNTAGAAAIIGTEARVGSGVAADCALSITKDLWSNKRTLGEATTTFRRKLVFSGNPLGFLFTAYGDVDLVVP